MTRSTGKMADPAWRRERASKAAKASHSVEAHVRAIVDRAPELTAAQRQRIAELLQPFTGPARMAAQPDRSDDAA